MRVTMLVRSTAAIESKIKARTAQQRQRVAQVTADAGQRVLARAKALCPVDTGFMVEHLRLEIGGVGDRFAVGFRAADFIGAVNPRGVRITAFYPVFLILGTRFMAGHDFLTAALRAERLTIRRDYAKALNVR